MNTLVSFLNTNYFKIKRLSLYFIPLKEGAILVLDKRPTVEDLIGEAGFPKYFRVLVRVDANGPKFTYLSKCPMNET